MGRPKELKTKIFLDSGDPEETEEIISLLGFSDGQTTNPSLIAKNPEAQKRLAEGKKFSKEEVYELYCDVVRKISVLIPRGSVSVEVYADATTTAEEMLKEGRDMFGWIPNAHIKFPITKEGLAAAETAVKEGLRVNMTLCFSEDQAAAVYAATKGAKKGDVFISPFVGRLDDKGENGMDLIKNILNAYERGDGHVEVLTASVRNLDHFLEAIRLGSDIITAPYKVLKEWGEKGMPMPDGNFSYPPRRQAGLPRWQASAPENLKPIEYKNMNLNKNWREYGISHELTDKGLDKFANDWNSLIVND